MEKVLLIQCLRGNSIGEIEIEHVKNEGDFYYNFKKESLKTELELGMPIFLVQYKIAKEDENVKKQCCGMALGKYEKFEVKSEDSEKCLLRIGNIKRIRFYEKNCEIKETDNYKKIAEIIEPINSVELNEHITHNLIQVDIGEEEFKVIELLADAIDSSGEGETIESEILEAYDKLERKETLSKLAQRSIYAKRIENKGGPRKNRTEYQRDWERIIHSKSFRRLEDKAQIYTLAKGDHFRTRLTHTLEVDQIARGIARELDLNEDLVQAIALGHDLGHTPFGHAGERTLNEILKKERVEGGFKHNFQGVKVVNYLEEKYGDFEGVDLTYQVMEGILKHTKICDCDKHNKKLCTKEEKRKGLECEHNNYKINKFLCNGEVSKLQTEYSFATTLEGQIVAIADEIAQRAHDLDDGIASGIIDEDDFVEELKKIAIGEFLQRLKIEAGKEFITSKETDSFKVSKLRQIANDKILIGINTKENHEFFKKIEEEFFKIIPEEIGENELKNIVEDEFLKQLQVSIKKYYTEKNNIEDVINKIEKNEMKEFLNRLESDYLRDNGSELLKNIYEKTIDKFIIELNECSKILEVQMKEKAKIKFNEELEKLVSNKCLELLLILNNDNFKVRIEAEMKDENIEDNLIEKIKNQSIKQFKEDMNNVLDYNSEQDDFKDELYIKISKSLDYIKEEKRDYIDKLDIKRARIVSDVITYFILKVVRNSRKEMYRYCKINNIINSNMEESESVIINEQLIKFSEKTEEVRERLEKITSKKVIDSEEVNCFDGKGEYIIRKLYNAYITNPKQMSKTTLKRIGREISRYTNDEIDIKKIYIKAHDKDGKVMLTEKDELKILKHKIFVRCIIDLISGMTDEFANKQFEKLYSPGTY